MPAAGAVAVPAADPVGCLTALLAARLRGLTPVVIDPAWPDGVRDDILRDAAQHLPPDGPERMVLLTSGSTGTPRAVVRTVASWTASFDGFERVSGVGAGDVVWAPGSLGSTLSLFAAWHGLCTGRPVLASGRWRGVPAVPAARRATVLHAVPAVMREVLTARERGLLPALRLAIVAGTRLPDGLRADADRLGVRLLEYYGAAELSFVAADPDGAGLRAFPGAELRVAGGEVQVRSPYLAEGYLSPATTGPMHRAVGGWAGVGDRGVLRGGVLTVLGRGDGAVDVGGHLVELAEVEAALHTVAGVADLACVGEPDPVLGSRVVGLLRAEPGADPLPALRAAARQRLPRPARPVRWVLLERLPRTPSGKPARQELAALAARSRA